MPVDKWITLIYKADTDGERLGVPVSDLCVVNYSLVPLES